MPVTLSIVTPSFNQVRFLDETLRSVVSQREQVHEYFVLDGGSTDGSVDVIRRYDKHIDHWESAKDNGQSDAIDRGFRRATGDVLGWINSDDVYLPGALARVRAAFERHPEWDVLTGYHVAIDADTRILALHRTPGESKRKARWGIVRVAQQACFFRRGLYERVGGLDLSLHCVMDGDLWFRMFDAGARWGHVPHYLAGYRWHATSKGMSWNERYAQERALMRERHPDYHHDARLRAALPLYRASHILSGRYPRARLETLRWRGRKLTDVFGDWVVPSDAVGR